MSKPDLIAPCGMNCSLCVAYQFGELDLNKHGFHRKYCPGCLPRGKHCLHMADACQAIGTGSLRFCFQCPTFPCARLKSLDKRYRTKYHMSMIANLKSIAAHGMDSFLLQEIAKWQCPQCGALICCHNGLCLHCSIDKLLQNRKYRWEAD